MTIGTTEPMILPRDLKAFPSSGNIVLDSRSNGVIILSPKRRTPFIASPIAAKADSNPPWKKVSEFLILDSRSLKLPLNLSANSLTAAIESAKPSAKLAEIFLPNSKILELPTIREMNSLCRMAINSRTLGTTRSRSSSKAPKVSFLNLSIAKITSETPTVITDIAWSASFLASTNCSPSLTSPAITSIGIMASETPILPKLTAMSFNDVTIFSNSIGALVM